LVPLQPGKNRIVVRAQIGNVWGEAERFVHYAPGSARPFVPADLEARRLRLVGADKEVEVDVEPGQERMVEVFLRDRREAEARAARQLKELHLEVDVAAPPPADAGDR
ncbi:MAG TPA: hypothetical protein VKB65_00225, partial [Myxococcota bacterium]|nr:hypothetical protein [Myxococcota bacterium]